MPEPLRPDGDVVDLLRRLIDVESVSGQEQEIADLVERSLEPYGHLELIRDGNVGRPPT